MRGAAVHFSEGASKLNGHSPAEAVDGSLRSVVPVKRISVPEAIEQFVAFRKGKTVAADGRGPQLSGHHWRNTGYWLRELADMEAIEWSTAREFRTLLERASQEPGQSSPLNGPGLNRGRRRSPQIRNFGEARLGASC